MKTSTVFVVFLTAIFSASAQTLPSLLDALRASGASVFADQIEADPTIAALYLSTQVQTVFAPIDNAYSHKFIRLGKRQSLTPAQQQALLLQSTLAQASIQSMRTLPGGSQIVTRDNSTLLKGKGQSVVSDARHKNKTKASKRYINRSLYPPTWTASELYPPNTWTASELYPPNTWTASKPNPPITWTASELYPPNTWTASKPNPPITWTASELYPPNTWTASELYPPNTWTASELYPPNTWTASKPNPPITWTPSELYPPKPLTASKSYPPTWTASELYPPKTWTPGESYPPTWTASKLYPSKTWIPGESYPPTSAPGAPFPPTWAPKKSYPPTRPPSESYPPTSTPSAPSPPISAPSKSYPPTTTSSTPSPPAPTPSATSLVEIFSGLGNSVNVIQGDIPYAGGLIQITDGQFTLPVSLSATVQATGESTFASLAGSANLTDALDNIPYSTFFIPSNEAFANADASSPSAATASLLEGHVIPNFVGYLPSLVNGSTLTTQTGSVVTVTIQGSDYYINDAMIVSSNLILENGVAHVIDKILTPSPQVYTGAASSTIQEETTGAFRAAVAAALFLAMMF